MAATVSTQVGTYDADTGRALRAAHEQEGRRVFEALARANNELSSRQDLIHSVHQFPLLGLFWAVPSRISGQVRQTHGEAT